MYILIYLLCGLAFIPELFNEKRRADVCSDYVPCIFG